MRWSMDHVVSAGASRRDSQPFSTVARRLRSQDSRLAYASDVARSRADLCRFARNSLVLVVDDGATHQGRSLRHLRIDEDLAEVSRWSVDQTYLTQIGESAPARDDLVRLAEGLCARARPACDGLEVEL
ncbi:MAG TPA: hypothetical protein VF148_03105 [Acidimicrobiia bacterium]